MVETPLDGLLVIDKPVGPTSHDVVARVRRTLREPRIGHAGTLDPMASGVLPLVIGRATRLLRFLGADDKRYEAAIRLGVATDTYDALGRETGRRYEGAMPSREAIERALDAFRGSFMQQPPVFSAKKIAGRRSYRAARAHARAATAAAVLAPPAPPALPAPASVTARLEIVGIDGDLVRLHVTCSGGFYVRSLAHDLGQALGTGAHLTALRRTEACGRTLADAISLDSLPEGREGLDRLRAALIPMPAMLPALPLVRLTVLGVRHAASGCNLDAADIVGGVSLGNEDTHHVKLLDLSGDLVGIAEPSSPAGLLHPVVVLM
jgi:tRNA pseudouridine55 synthase